MIDRYILVGQTPVPVDCDPYTEEGKAGLLKWTEWFEHGDRRVAQTFLLGGLVKVSTVFLAGDHNFGSMISACPAHRSSSRIRS